MHANAKYTTIAYQKQFQQKTLWSYITETSDVTIVACEPVPHMVISADLTFWRSLVWQAWCLHQPPKDA